MTQMKRNERKEALDTLVLVFKEKTPLSHTAKDLTPFSRALCFGVCRYVFELEDIANQLLKKRPKGLEVWLALLMGLYQLHHLNLPNYAVVKETVALLNHPKTQWAKGLINATLRQYCRLKPVALNMKNHPIWFIKKLQEAWPKDWESILKANDKHPPMSLRINQRKTTRDDYLKKIEGIAHEYSLVGIGLDKPCDVFELPGFKEGMVSVQDEAAQLAASLLNLKPGQRVLDACAAPGGKTAHILETEPELESCLALDIDERRLNRIRENLDRLQLKANLIKADASTPPAWWDGQLFDRILLDAPCSATGVIRRHPDIKIIRTIEEVQEITQVQAKLLEALWPCLKPGGLLVYATCSVLPEENEMQIAYFIERHADCEFISKPYSWAKNTAHGYQILPGEHNMDGFFYSVLKKTSPSNY